MDPNPFSDKDTVPDDEKMKPLLGETYTLLSSLKSSIRDALGATEEEWKYYGGKTGWLQKNLYNGRNLFFLRAGTGHFFVSFVFGEQATQCVKQSGISPGYIDALEQSPRYAEGRVLIVKVENAGALRNVLILLRCKIDH